MKKFWSRGLRNTLIALVSLCIAGAGVFLQNRYVNNRTDTESIVVAKQNIKPYGKLDEQLTTREVVKSEVPEDAIRSLDELQPNEDWVSGELGIAEGQPIRKSLVTPAKDSAYGDSVALEEGKMFVGIQTDQVRSSGDYIKPGVIADAYVYIAADADRPAQTITPATDPNLKGLLVKDRQNQDGYEPQREGEQSNDPIPAIAIIETDKASVAEALIRYQEEGRVYLVPVGADTKMASK